jgi:putative ABC transport system permease protein
MADLHQAIRSLRRSPTFTATAVATLALGIGATSAIFTIVNAALFKPLPYPNPDKLVVLTVPPGRDVAGQVFLHVRDRVQTLESVAAQGGGNGWNLVAGNLVAYTRSSRVSERFFATHGVQLILGREFSRAEDTPRGPDVAIISEALWRRAFAGSPSVLGQTVRLGSLPYTIVGVVPDSFRGIPDVDLWTPLRTTLSDNGQNYRVMGRIRDGVSTAQVASELDGLRPTILSEFPRTNPEYVALLVWMPYREFVGAGMRQTFQILLGAVAFLLLIACVNVASLHLTRSLGRRQEMALRAALGASRLRLVRSVFVESTLLATIGAVAGLALAFLGTQLLVSLVSEQLATQMLSGETVGVDWTVLGFTVAVTLACAVFFGMAPALTSMRADLRSPASEGLTTISRRTVWLRRACAGAEIALAVVLLVGAGLLLRTLSNLVSTELGFNPRGVLVGRMSLQGAIDAPQLETLLRQGLDRTRQIPGVTAASVSNAVPVERGLNLPIAPPSGARITQPRSVDWRYVTPEYFSVFDIRRLAGRVFDEADRAGGNPVAIVNEAFARGFFGRTNVVGETISLMQGLQDPPRQIVGVVADVKARSGSGWTRGLTALGAGVAPMMLMPAGQATSVVASSGGQRVWDLTWSFRADSSHASIEREVQDAVQAVDGRMMFLTFEPMNAVITRDLDIPRLVASLLTSFALLAILLAAVGLYGLMAHSTAQRAREVGIRMTLGATASMVLQRFMSEGLLVAVSGIALGLVGAASISRVLAALLFGVTPLDAATFAGVVLVLFLVAALATLLPAARAARIDPVRALRSD